MKRGTRSGTGPCDISRVLRDFGTMENDVDIFHYTSLLDFLFTLYFITFL